MSKPTKQELTERAREKSDEEREEERAQRRRNKRLGEIENPATKIKRPNCDY